MSSSDKVKGMVLQHQKRYRVLDVYVSATNPAMVLQQVIDMVAQKDLGYINVCTVHTMLECVDDPKLAEIVNQSTMAIPDGMPLVWLGRKAFPAADVSRCYGPDLMLSVCEAGVSLGLRHCLYGGTADVLSRLQKNLEAKFPGLRIIEKISPPFRELTSDEETQLVGRLNELKPDIIWVGLGTPKQDLWLGKFRKRLNVPVMIAVGAAFNFHAGCVRQAPRWMQQTGLEWLFRLIMEPRRLWKRYLIGNPRFLWLLFWSYIKR